MMEKEKTFKEKENELLHNLSILYTKLNQVREQRVKVEQESNSSISELNHEDGLRRRRRRILLVTRTLPFTLVSDDTQTKSQWRAEFPEKVSLNAAMETYLSIHEAYDCVWIGSVHGEMEPSEQTILKDQLQDRHYYPVFVDQKKEKLFYDGFCKTILWPLFHSSPPTTEDQLVVQETDESGEPMEDRHMEKMWQSYVSVNQLFADAIQEVYEEGDLIWIQGYHLTLVPQMVQNLYPNDNIHIGFFMHIPFPSSELYRIMNYREEILTGMLGADLIGFQTYEYARHFQSCAVRLLGLESSHKGVDVNGHFARVTICPVGIDADKFITLARSDMVEKEIEGLKQQFIGKTVILGVDRLDTTKGLVPKLLAVEELFTLKPELSREVVFVQIVTGGGFDTSLGAQVEALVSRINSKLQDIGADVPVQYLNQELPVETLIALYALADTIIITPIRDGMNTIPFEYVVCREAVGKHARVVLSDFAGCAHSLSGALLVNPWNTEEVHDALLRSLQDNEEVMRGHQSMYSYVSTFTTRHWADNYLEQLEECSEENALAVSGRELSRRDMTNAYIRSSKRLLFINYEGVLATETSIPELSYPPQDLLWQLLMLTKDPRNTVVLVSARSTSVCEQWFASLAGTHVVLAAEYGVYVKWMDQEGGQESWRCMVPNLDLSWWEHVVPLLEYYTERTPGAFIERKDSSVAWHYRDCDLDHGLWQASELLISLREITRSLPVAVVPGNRYLEVRPQKVSKASLFERIWEFMNASTLFPNEPPMQTDYFGEVVVVGNGTTNTVPNNNLIMIPPLTDLRERWRKTSGGNSTSTFKDEDDSDVLVQQLVQEHLTEEKGPPKRRRRKSGVDKGLEEGDEDEGGDDQSVDFVLVIASGDDRTDEDLFSVLVPPPIDLEAYCRQLEKEQKMSDMTTVDLLRRASSDSATTVTMTGSKLDEDDFVSPRIPLSRRRSWSSQQMEKLESDKDLLLPSPLSRLGSLGTDAELILLGDTIPKQASLMHKPTSLVSDDAATMFPRALLLANAPAATTRRDEITEKSKFTPRRDFPPSAALFKALKTKYGESFGMHKLPDTPAACWALVVPPTARAKLEDSATSTLTPSSSSIFERKSSTGSLSRQSSVILPECPSSPTGSIVMDDEGIVQSENDPNVKNTSHRPPPYPRVRRLSNARLIEDERGDTADNSTEADDGPYRFPVNTFVCTLGRKLSQAPYYIKNSADLFQLLQEMGLSSQLRAQHELATENNRENYKENDEGDEIRRSSWMGGYED